METKIAKVEKHLLEGKRLTARDSRRLFGYDRLAAGICRLREKHGWSNIRTVMVPNDDGTGTHAQYYMDGVYLSQLQWAEKI